VAKVLEDSVQVYGYSPDDEKLYIFNFDEEELQKTAEIFTRDIFFYMSTEDLRIYLEGSTPVEQEVVDNDYIWFKPGINKRHVIQCTCGNFLESGTSFDKLAKKGLAHHKRTGHTINLRGHQNMPKEA